MIKLGKDAKHRPWKSNLVYDGGCAFINDKDYVIWYNVWAKYGQNTLVDSRSIRFLRGKIDD